MVLSACLLKSHIKGKGSLWCGSRAAAAAALQWQAVDEACPPPCAHTSAPCSAAATVTGSPGRNHSGLSAGGEEEEESRDAEQRGCPQQEQQQ